MLHHAGPGRCPPGAMRCCASLRLLPRCPIHTYACIPHTTQDALVRPRALPSQHTMYESALTAHTDALACLSHPPTPNQPPTTCDKGPTTHVSALA
jgi:hypothetical protein